MTIDSYQHFRKYEPVEYSRINEKVSVLKNDYLLSHLEPELASDGVCGTVAVQARQSEEETIWQNLIFQGDTSVNGKSIYAQLPLSQISCARSRE
ncbi:MAG TPA: hypothetical protein VMW76_07455 [Bacteroidales bacterium]|nr:hypothetical protein [Bacteroidales bacterium]